MIDRRLTTAKDLNKKRSDFLSIPLAAVISKYSRLHLFSRMFDSSLQDYRLTVCSWQTICISHFHSVVVNDLNTTERIRNTTVN